MKDHVNGAGCSRPLGDSVQKYFGRTNIISQIRNKFSFHTDADLLRKSFERVPAGYTYDVLLGKEYQSHSIFYGSEMIMVAGLQHLTPASDLKAAIDSAFEDTIHIATIISSVFQRIIGFIMTEHLKITKADLLNDRTQNSIASRVSQWRN